MVLLVAATERELCGHAGLVCGIGPVEAAAATARELATRAPAAVLHVGVAGGHGVPVGRLVIGSEGTFADIGAEIPVVDSISPDPSLLAAVRSVLPDAPVIPITTTATVTTASSSVPLEDRAVEGMEGFAVLRACALAGVPAVEVRAISNEIGESDRSRWRIDDALTALADALPQLLSALAEAAALRQ